MIYTVVREPGRTVPLAQFIANAGSNLLDSASATFVVPASGTVAIQLEGTSRGALFRGGYQLLVSP